MLLLVRWVSKSLLLLLILLLPILLVNLLVDALVVVHVTIMEVGQVHIKDVEAVLVLDDTLTLAEAVLVLVMVAFSVETEA